jgi:hypothetical protein
VLNYDGPKSSRGIDPKKINGIVIDDMDARRSKPATGSESGAAKKFIGDGYAHDGNAKDGQCSLRFEPKLTKPGKYRLMLAAPPNSNRASNAPVEVQHLGGVKKLTLDLRAPKEAEGVHWIDLGEYECGNDTAITISNTGTDGYVVADGDTSSHVVSRWIMASFAG